jgi:hypothetical protein
MEIGGAMPFRWWLSFVAVLGVLLHAGALTRHHGVMLGTYLAELQLAADLAEICHGATGDATKAPGGLPSAPKPSDAKNACPICSGQAPSAAVVQIDPFAFKTSPAVPVRWDQPSEASPVGHISGWPPARGPPASDV